MENAIMLHWIALVTTLHYGLEDFVTSLCVLMAVQMDTALLLVYASVILDGLVLTAQTVFLSRVAVLLEDIAKTLTILLIKNHMLASAYLITLDHYVINPSASHLVSVDMENVSLLIPTALHQSASVTLDGKAVNARNVSNILAVPLRLIAPNHTNVIVSGVKPATCVVSNQENHGKRRQTIKVTAFLTTWTMNSQLINKVCINSNICRSGSIICLGLVKMMYHSFEQAIKTQEQAPKSTIIICMLFLN